MNKQRLQMILSDVRRFEDPMTNREQYMTPAPVAADLAHRVGLMYEVENDIVDLGCGTGMLSLAVGLKGFSVRGYDCDSDALVIAEENKSMIEDRGFAVDVEFDQHDVVVDETVSLADIVVMNPPFGMYVDDMNLRFLEAAFETAWSVVSLLHDDERAPGRTRAFIKRFASRHGFSTKLLNTYEMSIPMTRSFHDAEEHSFTVALYLFEEDDDEYNGDTRR